MFTEAPLYYAYTTTGIAAATLMFYATFIIASFLVGYFCIGERFTKAKIMALCLAAAGMGMVFHVSAMTFAGLGLLMAAVTGIASRSELALTKKVSNSYPALLILFYAWLAVFVTHLHMTFIMHEAWLLPVANTAWLAMIA